MTRTRIATITAVVALGAGAAGVATAATTPKRAADRAPAAQFEARLAQELGVSSAKLRAATEASGVATVRSLRASGKLDAGRAAKLEKAIRAGRTVPLTRLGKAAKGAGAPLRLVAAELGVTPKQLRGDLKAGKTPAAIITAAGKDPAAVKAAVQAKVRERLDRAVKAGRLTAAKADARAAKVAGRVTGDQPLKRAKRG